MKINMSWWQQISLREQILIKLLSAVLGFLLIIYVIYLPLSDALDKQTTKLKDQYQFLRTIQQSSVLIGRFQQKKIILPQMLPKSLLITAEKNLTDAKLSSYLVKIKQTNNKQVSLSFKQIPFDKMITWLSGLTHKYPITINQLSSAGTKDSGIVNATITLQVYS